MLRVLRGEKLLDGAVDGARPASPAVAANRTSRIRISRTGDGRVNVRMFTRGGGGREAADEEHRRGQREQHRRQPAEARANTKCLRCRRHRQADERGDCPEPEPGHQGHGAHRCPHGGRRQQRRVDEAARQQAVGGSRQRRARDRVHAAPAASDSTGPGGERGGRGSPSPQPLRDGGSESRQEEQQAGGDRQRTAESPRGERFPDQSSHRAEHHVGQHAPRVVRQGMLQLRAARRTP